MKLKNKRTGEIKEVIVGGYPVSGKTKMWECSEMDANEETGYKSLGTYTSLAELNEVWEDAPEEPKSINEIDIVLDAIGEYCNEHSYYSEDLEKIKILNTVEEKLKAWKRLKDKGFRFLGVKGLDYAIEFGVNPPYTHIIFDEYTATEEQKEFYNDLMLLFGGEE